MSDSHPLSSAELDAIEAKLSQVPNSFWRYLVEGPADFLSLARSDVPRLVVEVRRLRKFEACFVPHPFDEDPESGPDNGGWRCVKCDQGKSARAHSIFPGR